MGGVRQRNRTRARLAQEAGRSRTETMNIVSLLLFKAKLVILAIPLLATITGAGMNQAVLIANGGKFPVMINEVWTAKLDGEFLDDYHCRMTAQTHLNFLADYITFHTVVMSPG